MFSSLWLDWTLLWLWDFATPQFRYYLWRSRLSSGYSSYVFKNSSCPSYCLSGASVYTPNTTKSLHFPFYTSHYPILALLMCTAARGCLTNFTCVQFRLKQPIKPVIWEPIFFCTSHLVNNGVFTIPIGAGFLPSTVCWGGSYDDFGIPRLWSYPPEV